MWAPRPAQGRFCGDKDMNGAGRHASDWATSPAARGWSALRIHSITQPWRKDRRNKGQDSFFFVPFQDKCCWMNLRQFHQALMKAEEYDRMNQKAIRICRREIWKNCYWSLVLSVWFCALYPCCFLHFFGMDTTMCLMDQQIFTLDCIIEWSASLYLELFLQWLG